MTPLNYNHLYYFYIVATDESITRASKRLHLTPQTISGQISAFETQIGFKLFDRQGKRMQVSEIGRKIYDYAEEIFELGEELGNLLKTQQPINWQMLTVGIADVIPKTLAYQMLNPVFEMDEKIRLVTNEGDQVSLLADLAVDKLDMVLTDQALQPGSNIKAFNHKLAESNFTFFATDTLAQQCRENFPQSLSGLPFLMQGKKSAVRLRLTSWFDRYNIRPNVVAEFDDSALMKSFGQSGYGIFTGPSIIEDHICSQYHVQIVGRTDEIKEYYYAISPERRLKHPAVAELVNAASKLDFK